jgi:hypothetical protein
MTDVGTTVQQPLKALHRGIDAFDRHAQFVSASPGRV